METLSSSYPFYLANEAHAPNRDLEVRDVHSGEIVARAAVAGPEEVQRAIAAAEAAAEEMAAMPSFARKEALKHCVSRFRERSEELAMALCVEAGKPISDARGEVTRLIDTFEIASEEAVRISGEVLTMDISERAEGYRGMTRRVPVGPCAFITPFNFPLNLVAHKVAPAIAAGCPFVLKPADRTPIGALLIGEILAETELPQGAFSILPCAVEHADPLVSDQRLKLLSFTGSDTVGMQLAQRAGFKRVVLELGGNAACIVDEGVDVEDTVSRLVFGAFYQSGQSCVSVQRVIAHERIYEPLSEELLRRVRELKAGDPKDESTFIGPMIDENAAKRIEEWIEEAKASGATVLAGGKRDGKLLEATVLAGVPRDARIYREEAFAPVVLLSEFSEFDDAIAEANDSRYGLQTGVFTHDLRRAHRAWDRLEVGGVLINEVPSFRVDHMPYGGVKRSGLGREGVRSAIEHMTEVRLMVVRDVS